MAITFNADEIFEMAEKIERNAAGFYREAAKRTSDKAAQKLFVNLAAMEDNHSQIFQEMRTQLGPGEKVQEIFDPENQAILYLQTMADSHGTEGRKSRIEKLTGSESMRQIYEIAVNAEKDSVVFYTALKELVAPKAGRDKVEAIIEEELGHLVLLKMRIAILKQD
ncbi:MAG: ferritin family protein [Planctomycetota bacterium]